MIRPADLEGDAQAVAADQPLAVVDDRVGGLLQVERAVDLVGEALELVPEPLLRHHLPHLAVLEIGAGQVAEVADEPERALLLGRPAGRIHQDLEQADDLLVDHQRGDDEREVGRVERLGHPLDRPRPGGMIWACDAWIMQPSRASWGARLDPAVHQPGQAELDLILEPAGRPGRPSARTRRREAATAATARLRNST